MDEVLPQLEVDFAKGGKLEELIETKRQLFVPGARHRVRRHGWWQAHEEHVRGIMQQKKIQKRVILPEMPGQGTVPEAMDKGLLGVATGTGTIRVRIDIMEQRIGPAPKSKVASKTFGMFHIPFLKELAQHRIV